ncbi:MAG TPA: DUF4389 domain-containing protein [Rhizomicrobium sp.]
MSDNPNNTGGYQPPPPPPPPYLEPRPPFPGVRLLYAFGYVILAWFVLWVLFAIGLVQFAMFAINGRLNEELKGFGANLVQYLFELVAFIVFARDEQPFPIGPFPKHA